MQLKVKLIYKLAPPLDVEAPPACTFGQLKDFAAKNFKVPASNLTLLFRGRPKPDKAVLFAEGVKNGARIKRAIASVSSAVDALEAEVKRLPPDPGQEAARAAARLNEALTQKLLALDAVQVDPMHRAARRAEINRINRLCEQLEARKP
ncbi:hypothetical protein WJX81_008052 [Elliptochloris bilobata]|uniref:BAG family molecular chaperone regulator 1 n=1 Tax=Elliptochloris bilobata TaxID=381761 RepID=A0AAW1RTV8_9CHLO